MDTTQHFIIEKLLAELRAIQEALTTLHGDVQKQVETIREASQAQAERDKSPAVLRAEFQIPPAIYAEKIASETRNERRDKFKIGIEAATLFAVVAYAWINWHMLCQMKKANEAANESFAQTLCQMKAQTSAQKEAAAIAQGQLALAQRSLDTTIRSFHLDQRAWVGIKTVAMVKLSAGQKLRADLVVVNTGKTFALHAMVDATILSHHGPLNILEYIRDPNRPKMKLSPSIAVLFPNADTFVPGQTNQAVNSPTLEAITSGSELVYFFGDIHYDDIFHKRHLTRFCYQYFADDNTFHACSQNYNYAD